MMKRFILSMILIMSVFGIKAQDMMPMQELPLNPEVLHGTLPNGLNYYILHNEEPKNRANFYIAQKVGSSLETPEQLGLAHFLEHMAFNGTSHYPGKDMLNYLQGKGIRFGADINAYTSFDETVYNINNVPTNDQALMDSVLLVLYDWSGSILLEEDEINAERGVIEGEYIMRNDASSRMYTTILPQLYEEYQYRQMPIGKMEVVKNFPPQVLRDYYKKWYRPDLQGIIIVGDFDAAEMEKKVVALFSQIPNPENPAERIYPTISDNQQPIYVTFEDPELQKPRIDTFFKFERTPFEYRNTVPGFVFDVVISQMVEQMINNRLNEYAQKPECPYAYAGISIGTYLVSNQKGAVSVGIIPKGDYISAFNAAMGIITQACKTGFMGTEVQRVRDEILASYERMYNEKDKTNSESLGRELIRHFIENEPTIGIENEYQVIKSLLPAMTEPDLNEYASQLVHMDNAAIVISQPNTLELNIPAENEMISALNNILNADYEPYVDEVITEPLISNMPAPGSIMAEKSDAELGSKEFTLSNGVKVIVKPTDFSNDEILVQIFKRGGIVSYPADMAATVQGAELALEVSKIGPFNPTRLEKYLAGKKVGLNYHVGRNTNYFTGSSTVKDVASLFELIYASFTDVTPDQDTFDAIMMQLKAFYANQESNPEYIFQQKMSRTLYPNTPALYPLSLAVINEFDYAKILNLYHESVKNAADYTMVVVGNVDENTLKPLLEQYIASLPSTGSASAPEALVSVMPVNGVISESIDIPAQNPSVFLFDCIHQEGMPYNVKNCIMIDLMGDVLQMIFTETLREEMGGTYSPSAWASLNPYASTWTVNWYVTTNEGVMKDIIDRANAEFNKLMTKGTDMEHFNRVREAAIMQFDNQVRTNSYWLDNLMLLANGYDIINGYRDALSAMTLDEFNTFVTSIYNGANRIELVGIAK